jgi:hypothetical protein
MQLAIPLTAVRRSSDADTSFAHRERGRHGNTLPAAVGGRSLQIQPRL